MYSPLSFGITLSISNEALPSGFCTILICSSGKICSPSCSHLISGFTWEETFAKIKLKKRLLIDCLGESFKIHELRAD